MSTFELIIVALIAIYVFTSLYFSISGRKLAKEREQKEDERYAVQSDYEEQLKVLTKRIGEVATENDRLNGVVRNWMDATAKYKLQYETVLKEKEEILKEIEKSQEQATPKKRSSKKGGE